MPPIHQGTPWARHQSTTSRQPAIPPSRDGLRQTTEQAPIDTASTTRPGDPRDSSRQTGVASRATRARCPARSSRPSGCSMQQQAEPVERVQAVEGGRVVGAVGVDLDREGRGRPPAERVHEHLLGAGCHLDLGPGVALVLQPARSATQRVGRGRQAEHRPRRHVRRGDAEQVGERAAGRPQVGIPHGHLQGGPGQRPPAPGHVGWAATPPTGRSPVRAAAATSAGSRTSCRVAKAESTSSAS